LSKNPQKLGRFIQPPSSGERQRRRTRQVENARHFSGSVLCTLYSLLCLRLRCRVPTVARVRDTYGSGNPQLHPESAKIAPLLIGPATRRPWLWAAKYPDPTRAPMPRADRSSTQFCDSFPAKQRDSRGIRNKRGTKISRASRKSSRSEGGKGW